MKFKSIFIGFLGCLLFSQSGIAQSLNHFFTSRTIQATLGTYPQTNNDYIMVETLPHAQEEAINKDFNPFSPKFINKTTKSSLRDNKLMIEKIGYRINKKQLINEIYLSLSPDTAIFNYLQHKFGQYKSASAFGYVDTQSEPTTFSWVTPEFVVLLYINKNATLEQGKKDIVIILAKNLTP